MNIDFHESKGSVFTDIGVKNPLAAELRSQAMIIITRVIKSRGLAQHQAAAELRLTQPQVSYLMNGKLSKFSLEKLFEILNDLHRNVNITVEDARLKHPATTQIRELARA